MMYKVVEDLENAKWSLEPMTQDEEEEMIAKMDNLDKLPLTASEKQTKEFHNKFFEENGRDFDPQKDFNYYKLNFNEA